MLVSVAWLNIERFLVTSNLNHQLLLILFTDLRPEYKAQLSLLELLSVTKLLLH